MKTDEGIYNVSGEIVPCGGKAGRYMPSDSHIWISVEGKVKDDRQRDQVVNGAK